MVGRYGLLELVGRAGWAWCGSMGIPSSLLPPTGRRYRNQLTSACDHAAGLPIAGRPARRPAAEPQGRRRWCLPGTNGAPDGIRHLYGWSPVDRGAVSARGPGAWSSKLHQPRTRCTRQRLAIDTPATLSKNGAPALASVAAGGSRKRRDGPNRGTALAHESAARWISPKAPLKAKTSTSHYSWGVTVEEMRQASMALMQLVPTEPSGEQNRRDLGRDGRGRDRDSDDERPAATET